MFRLGTAWLVASVWFLALICEFGIYLYVRDTDLYSGRSAPCSDHQSNEGARNSTANSSVAEEGGAGGSARDQEVDTWRTARQKRFPKYEGYQQGRLHFQDKDRSYSGKRYQRYRRRSRKKAEEDKAREEELHADKKNALDVGATNELLTGDQSHQTADPAAVHVDAGDAGGAEGMAADDGGGAGGFDGGADGGGGGGG
jgi:hypothetical protein